VSSPPTAHPADPVDVPGLPRSILAAGACFLLGAAAATVLIVQPGQQAGGVLMPAWPLFGVMSGILLDQNRFRALATTGAVLSLVPLGVLVAAVVRSGSWLPSPAEFSTVLVASAGWLVAGLLIAIPGVVLPPARGVRTAAIVLVLTGSALVAGGQTGTAVRASGWVLVAAAGITVWVDVARRARSSERMARRRVGWLLIGLAAAGSASLAGWWLAREAFAGYVTAACLALVAVVVTWLCLQARFRPLDEPLLDLGLVLAVAAAATGLGVLVRLGAEWARMPTPGTPGALAAGLTAATAAPAALGVRRALLTRRYGQGAIAPDDVAVITADLRAAGDPRDLLDRAARMVAAASGCREARLVLGVELPEVGPDWAVHPLDVGGERVGSLAVRAGGVDGPEPRQEAAIARLLPTVALVAHAVTLAVEAELARRDVARQRDLERQRILADLHDGLGPVLAGMSMRVRAALRANGSRPDDGLLADLADGLAASRTDLRRIVAGITPSALDGGDLAAALERLVSSFRDHGAGGPTLALDVALTRDLPEPLQVAVYRCVAEGVTNALRHADASTIRVQVTSTDDRVRVQVVDDGAGGRIIPGVGLASLRARAESLGGRLDMVPERPAGLRLCLDIPCPAGVSA
jgi:signal transduction histidine kinase